MNIALLLVCILLPLRYAPSKKHMLSFATIKAHLIRDTHWKLFASGAGIGAHGCQTAGLTEQF